MAVPLTFRCSSLSAFPPLLLLAPLLLLSLSPFLEALPCAAPAWDCCSCSCRAAFSCRNCSKSSCEIKSKWYYEYNNDRTTAQLAKHDYCWHLGVLARFLPQDLQLAVLRIYYALKLKHFHGQVLAPG